MRGGPRKEALIAEAKAFREAAAAIAEGAWPPGFYSWSGVERDAGRMTHDFRSRLAQRVEYYERGRPTPTTHDDWVLALCWLALECEDEARSSGAAPKEKRGQGEG